MSISRRLATMGSIMCSSPSKKTISLSVIVAANSFAARKNTNRSKPLMPAGPKSSSTSLICTNPNHISAHKTKINREKLHFFEKKCKNICVCQKKAVLLHPLLKNRAFMVSTRISVLHRILVPRSEVRLLGGQQKAALAAFIVESRKYIDERLLATCDGIHGIK